MESQNEHFSLIDLLPQYRLLNSMYQQTVDRLALSFSNQCFVTDFFIEFSDKQAFEKSVMNALLSIDKEKLAPIITNLKAEIHKNIDTYSTNKDFFDGINAINVCAQRHNPFRVEIDGQLKDTNRLWQELTRVRNSLESANWKNDKITTQRLTGEEERLESQYKKEQKKLQSLYQQQSVSDKNTSRYIKNKFEDIFELSCSFSSLLDNYFPVEKEKEQITIKPAIKSGLYFDMKLVSLIHNECNNIQFENLSELDLYTILNLQPTNAKLIIKSGERTRMCYLIYKLYEWLKTDNRTEWRAAILESAGIEKKYYDSKYKEPESEIPSRKSESFAQRINKIFKYIS